MRVDKTQRSVMKLHTYRYATFVTLVTIQQVSIIVIQYCFVSDLNVFIKKLFVTLSFHQFQVISYGSAQMMAGQIETANDFGYFHCICLLFYSCYLIVKTIYTINVFKKNFFPVCLFVFFLV